MRISTRYVHRRLGARRLPLCPRRSAFMPIMGNHDWWDDRDRRRTAGSETFGHSALAGSVFRSMATGPAVSKRTDRASGLPASKTSCASAGQESHRDHDRPRRSPERWRRSATMRLSSCLRMSRICSRKCPRVSLTLSGHTHGGQIRLFGYSPVVPSRFDNRYVYGHIVENDRNIIVSGGLGCSIAADPLRFTAGNRRRRSRIVDGRARDDPYRRQRHGVRFLAFGPPMVLLSHLFDRPPEQIHSAGLPAQRFDLAGSHPIGSSRCPLRPAADADSG